MVGKQHEVAEFLANAIVVSFPHEEAPQPVFTDVSFDGRGILALSRDGQRPAVDIRAEYLNGRPDVLP